MNATTKALIIASVQLIIIRIRLMLLLLSIILVRRREGRFKRKRSGYSYSMIERIPEQNKELNKLVNLNDTDCIDNLRMDRNTFHRLTYVLQNLGGLQHTKWVSVQEQTALFLTILAHHKKNRVIKYDFNRSGQTISHFFNNTLEAMLRIHDHIFIKPTPIGEDCTNERWKCFKGCLGALDGTYIDVCVPLRDQIRYRSRKGNLCTNVLGVCDINLNFIYILSGWEGSAADGRVLRDAVARPTGLKVPTGNYYLCDCGYTNGEGFLTPYRNVRYHLDDLGPSNRRPANHEEYFNMKHSRARNVIERAFCLLKGRWVVLRSKMFYSIIVQNRIIIACALLHNFIRVNMAIDPLTEESVRQYRDPPDNTEYIDIVEPSEAWHDWRDTLAIQMFNTRRPRRRR